MAGNWDKTEIASCKPVELTPEELAAFVIVARSVLRVDDDHQSKNSYEASTRMLNQLWSCGLSHSEFERFSQIINDAADSDFRCPK
jgi:hypothetical protein